MSASYADLLEFLEELPTAIRLERRRRGLSVEAAAHEAAVGSSFWRGVEGGSDFRFSGIRPLVDWLICSGRGD